MTMWMVRAESDGSLFQPFIEKGLVAIGWSGVGDLGRFESKERLVAELREQYPGKRAGWYANAGGMLHRFSKKLQAEDGVVSYDRTRRVYAVGKLQGEYEFDLGFDPDYPNVRRVEWEAMEVSRDALATATKNSLGSTLTLFQLPETAEQDVWGAASCQQAGPSEDGEEADEEEKLLLEDLKSRSIEFIKDRIVRLDWEDMQFLVAGILRAMGYKTRISARGPDRGVDIVASRDGFGFENPRIVVEVKHRTAQVSAVRDPELRGRPSCRRQVPLREYWGIQQGSEVRGGSGERPCEIAGSPRAGGDARRILRNSRRRGAKAGPAAPHLLAGGVSGNDRSRVGIVRGMVRVSH